MNLRKIRFGIEIETVRRTRRRVAEAIQSVVGGQVRHVGTPVCFDPWTVTDERGRVWRVDSDGSLSDVHPGLRAELVSPVLGYDDIPMLLEVVRAVRHNGAKTNLQCGIHIHVDSAPFNGKTLGNLAKIIYKQEPLILSALCVNETRLRHYSRPVSDELIVEIERLRPRTKVQLRRIWYGYHNPRPRHFDPTRYYGVNLHNVWYRGTVEFRWFESTLHAGKIKAYIQPIRAGRIIGTHNGTIYNADRLFKRFRLRRLAEVDSELLFRLADREIHHGLKRFKRHLLFCRGQISAVLSSRQNPTRSLVLKGNRPLEFRWHPRYRVVIYASESRFLDAVLTESGWNEIRVPEMSLVVFSHEDLTQASIERFTFRTQKDGRQEYR